MSLLPPRSDFGSENTIEDGETRSDVGPHRAGAPRLRAGKRKLATNRWRAVKTWGIKRRAG